MSLAYFIVLDKKDVEFDDLVNGKNIAQAFDELSGFCESHDLKGIEDFHYQDVSEFIDDFDDLELPAQEEVWFDAREGIEWVSALIAKLKGERPKFLTDAILEDLVEYLEVFKNAESVNAKWHLELDF